MTFTDSLARLIGDEKKAVKTTAFDLQMNSASPAASDYSRFNCRSSHASVRCHISGVYWWPTPG